MALTQTETEIVYNPSSLLAVFTNTLNNDTTKRPFRIKGLYTHGNGISYKGFYFDSLKDEATETTLTIVVPGLIRSKLVANKIIECNAYLTKKVQLNGGRIDLQVNITEVLSQDKPLISEDQVKAFEILQTKAEKGHKDVDSFLRSKIINGETVAITILIGKSGIIDEDIKHQLQEGIGFYKLYFVRINLSSEREIIESLNFYNRKSDILGISRGGGDNLEIFNSPLIAETSLSLTAYFITAIGHQQDIPLLQKVADKGFITPTALGQYLRETYNDTVAQLNNSKAKLINDVKLQLEANYSQQIQNLQKELQGNEELRLKELTVLNRELEHARNQKKEIPTYVWIIILAAVIVGVLIGAFFTKGY